MVTKYRTRILGLALLALLGTLSACGDGGSSTSAPNAGSDSGATSSDFTSDASIEKCYGEGELDEFGTSSAGYGADVAVTNSGDSTADYAVTVVFERDSEQLASMTAELHGVAPGDTATTNVTPVKFMRTFTCRITSVERSGGDPAESDDEAGADLGQTCKDERSSVATALEAYNAANGSYPDSIDDVVGTFIDSTPKYWTFTGTLDEDGSPVLEPVGDLPAGCDS